MATARQGAVAELAPLLDLRQEIELRGRAASDVETDPEPFLAWAEDPHGLGDRAWLRWVAWLGPIAVVALGIADLSGVIPAPLWGVPLLVNLLVGATAARRAYATIAEVVTEQRAIDRLRRAARGAGRRRFHGSRVAASPGTVGNRRARRAGNAAPPGTADRDGDPALVDPLCANPGADALGRARPVRAGALETGRWARGPPLAGDARRSRSTGGARRVTSRQSRLDVPEHRAGGRYLSRHPARPPAAP